MNNTRSLSFVPVALLLVMSTALSAAPSGETIARQGNGKGVAPCMSCHGDKGQGKPTAAYPYLAGQPAAYLVKQLEDFASKRRSNPVMQPMASALSAGEIQAVANYYSQLPLPKTSLSQKDAVQASTGESLVVNGKWSSGMPACFKCHGDKGQGVVPHFPAISGQSSTYLKQQLQSWQKGERTNDPAGLMQAVVSHLSDSDIAEVAAYLATQSATTTK